MKYEYQDLLYKHVTNEFGEQLSKDSLDDAEIIVSKSIDGVCYTNDENCNPIYITFTYGSIEGVQDSNGSEFGIDFSIYKFYYGGDLGVEITCKLKADS